MSFRRSVKDLGEILDSPVALIRDNFKQLLPVAAIPSAAAAIAGFIASLGSIFDNFAITLVSLVISLLSLAVLLPSLLAIYANAIAVLEGEKIGVGEAFRRGMSLNGAFTLFVGFIGMYVGFFLCCVPGMVVYVLLFFMIPLAVEERIWFFDNYQRSGQMAAFKPENRASIWIQIALISIAYFGIQFSLGAFAMIPQTTVEFVAQFRAAMEGAPGAFETGSWWLILLSIVTLLVQILVSTFVYSYLSLAVALLFRSTREEMTGIDVERALRERGARFESSSETVL